MSKNSGCLGIFLEMLGLLPKSKQTKAFPYALRDDFLSPSELSFYKILRHVIGSTAVICPKVNLSDIVFVTERERSQHTILLNKINRKHVDFLICSPENLKPLYGIELDDSSHKRSDRKKRDAYVNEVFEAANLRLIRFQNKQSYTIEEVKAALAEPPRRETPSPSITEHDSKVEYKQTERIAVPVNQSVPTCPKCGISMVFRKATRGENKGQSFYGCAN